MLRSSDADKLTRGGASPPHVHLVTDGPIPPRFPSAMPVGYPQRCTSRTLSNPTLFVAQGFLPISPRQHCASVPCRHSSDIRIKATLELSVLKKRPIAAFIQQFPLIALQPLPSIPTGRSVDDLRLCVGYTSVDRESHWP